MPYDRSAIFEQAKKEAESKQLIWLVEIEACIGIAHSTFFEFFPDGSNESNTLKAIIAKNRVTLSLVNRRNMLKSNNPTCMVALAKILGTEEEAHRLNGSKTETKTEITGGLGLTLTPNQVKEISDALDGQL